MYVCMYVCMYSSGKEKERILIIKKEGKDEPRESRKFAKIGKVTSIFRCKKKDTLSNIARITNLVEVQT